MVETAQEMDRLGWKRAVVYLTPLVVGPLLLLLLAFWVIPSPWYAQCGTNFWMASLGYGATLHGANCEIVVAGDSTAMVGVNPAELSRLTHQSVCNVAEMYSVILESGNAVLDQYLAQNQRPRVLLFLFAPEGFDPNGKKNSSRRFEGITYKMRSMSAAQRAAFMVRRPVDFLRWVSAGLDGSLWYLRGPRIPEAEMTARARLQGQFPLMGQSAYQCAGHDEIIPPDPAWVRSLRKQYGTGGTAVLIDVMPVPSCQSNTAQIQHELNGLVDNSVSTLPVGVYYGGGRHVDAQGSLWLTQRLAQQILDLRPSQGAS